jgi:hypothetical protein
VETPKLWVRLNWTGKQTQTIWQGFHEILPNVSYAIQAFVLRSISDGEALWT